MHRYGIPVAVAIAAAIIAFFFFSGYIALPLKTINSSTLPFIKTENGSATKQFPVGFTLKGDQPYSVIFSTDERNDMKVYMYWYVWNHDGNQKKDDPEPVFVYYKGSFGTPSSDNGAGSLFAIAHRIHYQWTVKYDGIITQGNNPVITFMTSSHTPDNSYPIEPSKYEQVKLDPKQERSVPYQGKDPWTVIDTTASIERSIMYALATGGGAFVISAAIARSKTKNKTSHTDNTLSQ
jgi:hypothetical protein